MPDVPNKGSKSDRLLAGTIYGNATRETKLRHESNASKSFIPYGATAGHYALYTAFYLLTDINSLIRFYSRVSITHEMRLNGTLAPCI